LFILNRLDTNYTVGSYQLNYEIDTNKSKIKRNVKENKSSSLFEYKMGLFNFNLLIIAGSYYIKHGNETIGVRKN